MCPAFAQNCRAKIGRGLGKHFRFYQKLLRARMHFFLFPFEVLIDDNIGKNTSK